MSLILNQAPWATASATVSHPLNAVIVAGGIAPGELARFSQWTSGPASYEALILHAKSLGFVREKFTASGHENVAGGAWNGTTVTITMATGSRVVTPV